MAEQWVRCQPSWQWGLGHWVYRLWKFKRKHTKPDGFSSLKRLLADNLQHPIVWHIKDNKKTREKREERREKRGERREERGERREEREAEAGWWHIWAWVLWWAGTKLYALMLVCCLVGGVCWNVVVALVAFMCLRCWCIVMCSSAGYVLGLCCCIWLHVGVVLGPQVQRFNMVRQQHVYHWGNNMAELHG